MNYDEEDNELPEDWWKDDGTMKGLRFVRGAINVARRPRWRGWEDDGRLKYNSIQNFIYDTENHQLHI